MPQVRLIGTSPYLAKDQRKADRATKFIGRGSLRSSTNSYRQCFKDAANCGVYNATDYVFISSEGNRSGRLEPDWSEIELAIKAGASFITDVPADRARWYNIGERAVAAFLETKGYCEAQPGLWQR